MNSLTSLHYFIAHYDSAKACLFRRDLLYYQTAMSNGVS